MFSSPMSAINFMINSLGIYPEKCHLLLDSYFGDTHRVTYDELVDLMKNPDYFIYFINKTFITLYGKGLGNAENFYPADGVIHELEKLYSN